jgi:hypothetical protein
MLAEPQSVTINTVANSLPRVSTGVNSGAFRKEDGNITLDVNHTYGSKRTRRWVKLTHKKIAADPLISAQSILYSMGVSITVDVPITGYTVAEAKQIVDALTKWATDTSGSNITKLLGGES